ncbi:unnamed protein product (macronuclear) [Paramecium tetraurelia]|uniref:50S ribosomal protein L35 n=1 Tax=Paramecium tetraurelia TaxID=5888 RepID=A0C2J1_PARTE|nr:uncharacterized protein GSPATT00034486001 [Paramecium tetraurelia]CAK65008.1 unnamed protein product [Paramecium tetraurelia]|eukprot:XP_001432405.1 hypothetical protein (macronuclear) [Paramecium tetraurelia strain d4-2]
MLKLATQTVKLILIPVLQTVAMNLKPVQDFGLVRLLRQARIASQARTKSKCASSSWKKRIRTPNQLYKIGDNKGVMKRVKIVGPRRLKFKPPGSRHLNRNCSKAILRRMRRTRYISDVNMPKMRKLLPLMRRQKSTSEDRELCEQKNGWNRNQQYILFQRQYLNQ